eukprot:200775_1
MMDKNRKDPNIENDPNSVLYLILKTKVMYNGCHQFAYWSEYFNVMMAPESKVETVYCILKMLLSRNATISLVDINHKFRIHTFFKNEFSSESLGFMKKICPAFLSKNRAPIAKTSTKKLGTVLDRIFSDDSLQLNLVIEEEFSDSEFEAKDEDNNNLENNQSESDDDNDILNDDNFDEIVRNHLSAVLSNDTANEIMDVDLDSLECKEDDIMLVKSCVDDAFQFGRTEIFRYSLLIRMVQTVY